MTDKARHDWEEDMRWHYDVPPERLAELREPPQPMRRRAWWLDCLCPLCACLMSGDRDVPNTRNEACEDFGCPCHKELA